MPSKVDLSEAELKPLALSNEEREQDAGDHGARTAHSSSRLLRELSPKHD